jgi:hypothetical protein
MLNMLKYPDNMLVSFVLMLIVNLEIILKRLKYKTCLEPNFVNSSTVAPKPPRFDNVLVNVIVVVTICSQQPKQHVLKDQKLVKTKGGEDCINPNWELKFHVRTNTF